LRGHLKGKEALFSLQFKFYIFVFGRLGKVRFLQVPLNQLQSKALGEETLTVRLIVSTTTDFVTGVRWKTRSQIHSFAECVDVRRLRGVSAA